MLETWAGGVKPRSNRVDARPKRHRAARAPSLGIGTDEQADGGDAGRARCGDRRHVIDGHPANRQDRHPDGLNDARQAIHTEQHTRGLRRRREYRACDQVVDGARRPGLVDTVYGPADEKRWRRDAPHGVGGHRVASEVRAVGPARHGDINPVVHHNSGPGPAPQPYQAADQIGKISRREITLTHLHEVDSRINSVPHLFSQTPTGLRIGGVRTHPAAVSHEAQCHTGP
jgi:hypothetical protein